MHRSFSVITVTDAQGKEMVKQKKFPNNGEIIELFQTFNEPIAVAVESSGSWYWLYDLLEENRIEAKLSHPLKTKLLLQPR